MFQKTEIKINIIIKGKVIIKIKIIIHYHKVPTSLKSDTTVRSVPMVHLTRNLFTIDLWFLQLRVIFSR